MRALGCPVRAAMRGPLVPFQALPSEGHVLVGSADELPRAQQCCGAPARRNGLRLPRGRRGLEIPRAAALLLFALVCRYASKANLCRIL